MPTIYMIRGQIFNVPVLVNWFHAELNRPGTYMTDLDAGSHRVLPDGELQKMRDGWAVIDRQGQDLPDFIGGFSEGAKGYTLVNARARALIEETDAATHRFTPASVWDKRADAEDRENPLWIWRLNTLVDTVDLGKSLLHRGTRGRGGPPFVALVALAPYQCVLLPGFTPPHTLWRDRETAQVFCTDSFERAYKAAGLTGLDFVGTTSQ